MLRPVEKREEEVQVPEYCPYVYKKIQKVLEAGDSHL
jgi:hypothetical protein